MTASLNGLRRPAFIGVLFGAMGAATLPMTAIGILATFIVDDLGITRATLGWIAATNVMLAAALSPIAGQITDHIGGRKAAALVFASSATAFVVFGTAAAVWVMFAASVFAAIAQATGNPATNLLIRTHLAADRRGIATGIKQSGAKAGSTVAGLVLPSVAIALGWGTALTLVALLPLLGLVLVLLLVPPTGQPPRITRAERVRLPSSVRWLAAYALVFGFAGAVTFYVPLYVEESIGLDPRIGGLVAALMAATAFVVRIASARVAGRTGKYLKPLFIMALGGVGAAILMASGTVVQSLIWPGAIAIGATSSAWNSVGMLAVINKTGETTGRSSGVVVLGYLVGLGIGPPVYGASIDATGSYATMWILSLLASALGAVVIATWRRTNDDVWAIADPNAAKG